MDHVLFGIIYKSIIERWLKSINSGLISKWIDKIVSHQKVLNDSNV